MNRITDVWDTHPSLADRLLAIQKLEDELDVMLLERTKTEVTVTPIGKRIIEQAQRALEEVGKIKSIARQGKDQLVGPLRLGVIYTVGPYLLPALIPVLRRRAPAFWRFWPNSCIVRVGKGV